MSIVFTIIFLASPIVSGDEGFKLRSSDFIKKQTYDLKGDKGQVHVIIHSKGHLQGMPYVVDLRPACLGNKKDVNQLETLDIKSACAIDISSLKINSERTEISIDVHRPSIESYNKQITKSMLSVNPECEQKPVTHTFSIQDFCS